MHAYGKQTYVQAMHSYTPDTHTHTERHTNGEMAQQLKAPATNQEDLGSILYIHMAAHKCLVTPVSGNLTTSHKTYM